MEGATQRSNIQNAYKTWGTAENLKEYEMKTLFCLGLFCTVSCMAFAQTHPEQKLKELKIELPQPGKPVANYVKYVRTGNLIFMAGEGPRKADRSEEHTSELQSRLQLVCRLL